MARSTTVKALMVLGVASMMIIGCGRAAQTEPAAPAPADAGADIAPADAGLLEGITMNTLDGGEASLADYRGRAVLIVNTASQCGFARHFEGLQNLHQRYADQGLVVIGVPSGDFGGQEYDDADDIRAFCEENYGVEFLMLEKSHVKGDDQVELFRRLTDPSNDGDDLGEIEWNFEKFVLDRDGQLIARFRSRDEPESEPVIAAVERALERS